MAIRRVTGKANNSLCRDSHATEGNPAQEGKRALSGRALIENGQKTAGGIGESRNRPQGEDGAVTDSMSLQL